MSLLHHPKPGEIVMCAFPAVGSPCAKPPEMVKTRSVVILSRNVPGRSQVVTVVPISMTMTGAPKRYHIEVPPAAFPASYRAAGGCWAKCDMVCTVSLDRLDFIAGPKQNGKRPPLRARVDMQTLVQIRAAVADVTGIKLESPPTLEASADAVSAALESLAVASESVPEESAAEVLK